MAITRDDLCSSKVQAMYLLLYGVEISIVHVARCRHVIIARVSSDIGTMLLPPPPPVKICAPLRSAVANDWQKLPTPLFLVLRQRIKLLAAADSIAFHLICRLSCKVFQVSCTRHASRTLRRWLLMRASNARLPYCLALLQSNAVLNGAGDAAKAVTTATKAVEATVDAQRLNTIQKGKSRKSGRGHAHFHLVKMWLFTAW